MWPPPFLSATQKKKRKKKMVCQVTSAHIKLITLERMMKSTSQVARSFSFKEKNKVYIIEERASCDPRRVFILCGNHQSLNIKTDVRCALLTEMGEKKHSFIKCDVDLFINDIYIKQSHGSVSYFI
jgi:hypothetical protein